jgi:PleD family two-component response regulator
MPNMTSQSKKQPKKQSDQPLSDRSILLASDSERHGTTMHRALQKQKFAIEYAGDDSQLDARLSGQKYDVVLLEVTGEHAVEPAVEAALRVKRADAQQFVGYLADAGLETNGLAGDAVLPRSAAKLPDALRRFMAEGAN